MPTTDDASEARMDEDATLGGEHYDRRDEERRADDRRADSVNHPAHYGGADNVYEAIKVIEAWGLGFCLGNALKYVCRAGKKHRADAPVDVRRAALDDLMKARWYLDREIHRLEAEQ